MGVSSPLTLGEAFDAIFVRSKPEVPFIPPVYYCAEALLAFEAMLFCVFIKLYYNLLGI
jgi:hypothetical protein